MTLGFRSWVNAIGLGCSARGPRHQAPAQDVAVQMGNAFPPIRTVVNHKSITGLIKGKIFCHLGCLQQQMAEQFVVGVCRLPNSPNRPLRND